MVTIVTTYKNQSRIFEHYWCPLIHKHGDVEFLILDHDSRIEPLKYILPKKKNITYISQLKHLLYDIRNRELVLNERY